MKIWILTIEHRHGTDVSAFANDMLALAELAGYAREWWNDGGWMPESDPPEDDGETINKYFENVGDEYYSLNQVELIGFNK